MLGGLVLALMAGFSVAEGNYMQMAMYAGALVGSIYALFLNQGWIHFGFLWGCTCFLMQPIGFSIGTMEVGCLLAAIYIFMNGWRKSAFDSTPVASHFKPFVGCVILLILYCGIHFLYNRTDPWNNEFISWKTAAKQYLLMTGGFLLISVAVSMPKSCWQLKNPVIPLAWCLLIGNLINIAIRGYATFVMGAGQVDIITGMEFQIASFHIPILNLTDNIYALRTLAPLSAVMATAMLTSKAAYARRNSNRLLAVVLFVCALAGAMLSSGRATLIMVIFLSILLLLMRKRYVAVALATVASILFIVSARALYEYDDRLISAGLQRSLAMIPGMGMERAKASIDSSSDWRTQLFYMALDDWKQSPRTILTGRCVYEFTERDSLRIAGDDVSSYTMITAVRRGATHTVLTDLLVTVGLVGLLLYLTTYGALLSAIYSSRKELDPASPLYDIRLPLMIILSVSLPLGIIASGFVQPTDAFLVATLACASIGRGTKRMKSERKSP